ncbi:MAG: hypothetical protein GY913_26150 [Proteobacteria bacterium]|nr:hypothetical protein [Pseudomonadota bacterium]MCP4920399.1 hypothetical protein [Pseudomonadota bacterium]
MSTALIASFLLACSPDVDPRFGGGGSSSEHDDDSGTDTDTGGSSDGDAPSINDVDWAFEDAPNTTYGTNLVLRMDITDPQDDLAGGVLNLKLATTELDLEIDDGSGTGARDVYWEDGAWVTNINVPADAYEVFLVAFDAEENSSDEFTFTTE